MSLFYSTSEAETLAIASDFAKTLKPDSVVAYRGGLGMGKTLFTRGVVQALGNTSFVSSPTFAIVNDYGGIYHFDMYRIDSLENLYYTGFYDYLGNGILLIEWSENVSDALPENTIFVEISPGRESNERIINIYGEGVD